MGADDEAADYAVSYLRIVAPAPIRVHRTRLAGLFAASADLRTLLLILAAATRSTSFSTSSSSTGLDWGIEGSAAATAVGQTVMGAAFIAALAALGGA